MLLEIAVGVAMATPPATESCTRVGVPVPAVTATVAPSNRGRYIVPRTVRRIHTTPVVPRPVPRPVPRVATVPMTPATGNNWGPPDTP
jgi:hypothetical protein